MIIKSMAMLTIRADTDSATVISVFLSMEQCFITVYMKNTRGRAFYIEGLPTAYAALIISTTVTVLTLIDYVSQAYTLRSFFFF
jgi:hypothetical protein